MKSQKKCFVNSIRRLYIIPVLFLASSFLAKTYSQVSVQVKAGINVTTTKNLIEFPENRVGMFSGADVQIALTKNLLLQPELLYSGKGYRYEDLSNGKKVAVRLNYISLPILLGYRFDTKTTLLLGSELSYLTKAVSRSNYFTSDATESFPKKFDAGAVVGIAYNATKLIGVEVRYVYGFDDFFQVDAVGLRRSEYTAANRTFQLNFYYILFKSR